MVNEFFWPGQSETVTCPICEQQHHPGRMDEWDPCMITNKGLRYRIWSTMLSSRGADRTISLLAKALLEERGESPEYTNEEAKRWMELLNA